jgi:Holliday junction resolvasome RuvABC endonuclease subunit
MGVDASTVKTGMVVIDRWPDGSLVRLWHGSFVPEKGDGEIQKRVTIAREVLLQAQFYGAEVIGIEHSFFSVNPQVGETLTKVIGTIENACWEAGLSVILIAPTSAQKALGISKPRLTGVAKKNRTVERVNELLGITLGPKEHDIADAAAVAVAVAQMIEEKGAET